MRPRTQGTHTATASSYHHTARAAGGSYLIPTRRTPGVQIEEEGGSFRSCAHQARLAHRWCTNQNGRCTNVLFFTIRLSCLKGLSPSSSSSSRASGSYMPAARPTRSLCSPILFTSSPHSFRSCASSFFPAFFPSPHQAASPLKRKRRQRGTFR